MKNSARALIALALCFSAAPALARDLVNCNHGAMIISEDPSRARAFVATVYDRGVVDFFVAQAQGYETGRGYGGAPASVQKRLPWMAQVNERHELAVQGFRAYADGSFLTSGPGGGALTPRGAGFELHLSGQAMPDSHSSVYYTIGSWFFEHCVYLKLAP